MDQNYETRRVFVVDDDRESADILVSIFFKYGVEAFAIYNGESALEATRLLRPDVIFLDLLMPIMSGFTVAEGIRSMTTIRQPCLVALSCRDDPETRGRVVRAGFDLHVVKPACIDLLLAIVEV